MSAVSFWIRPVGGDAASARSGLGLPLATPTEAATPGEHWQWREVWNEPDWPSLARATALEAGEIAARLRKGARCVALAYRGMPVTTAWISTGPEWVSELPGWFVASRADVYIWDCFTQPPARGQGLYAALLGRIADWAAAQGAANLWLGIEWQNWQSIRGVTSAGFRPVGLAISPQHGTDWNFRILPAPSAAPPSVDWLTRALHPPGARPPSAGAGGQYRQTLKRSAAGRGGLATHRRALQ